MRAVALLGPTASGKTELSLRLAQTLPLEIVSVDSALIYKRMNVGTAKPDAQTLAAVPHHLINVAEPWDPYDVLQFVQAAQTIIAQVNSRGNVALLAGGTMMYFHALTQGLSPIPSVDATVRDALNQEYEQLGFEPLYLMLKAVDPQWAQSIAVNDRQRLIRGLSVFRQTGKPLSYFHQRQARNQPSLSLRAFAPGFTDRQVLHQRIEARFLTMLEQGLVDEVKALHQHPKLHAQLPAMRAVGYRQCWAYLDQQLSFDQFVEKSIVATRQLAKRQMTWLRRLKAVEQHGDPNSLYNALRKAIQEAS